MITKSTQESNEVEVMTKQRPFAVFDIDGTLIRWQLYHAIVNQLAKAGYVNHQDYASIKTSRMQWKKRAHEQSYKEYEKTVVQAFHTAIESIDQVTYECAIDEVLAKHKEQVYTFTRDLIASLKEKGYILLAISGSQQEIVERLAQYYGFDDASGNQYEIIANSFTGKHAHSVERKEATLKELIDKHSLTMDESIAVGDSENDIPLLDFVKHPIAFNPTNGLMERARAQQWRIVVERKNAIYDLRPSNQGYILQ